MSTASLHRPALLLLAALLTVAALAGHAGRAHAAGTGEAPSTGEAPGGVGSATWTVTPFTVDVQTGPEDGIAVTIDADLWMPSTASAADPAPAVIHTHGFGGNKANNESLANAAYLASHGYVVITHSTQGFGGSTGCIGLDSTDYDAKNLGALVDVLAAMPEVATDAPGDPKVGLLGGSYGGGLQGGAAFLDPRVDAIAPGRTWNALQFSLVPNNWVVDPEAAATDLTARFDLMVHEQGVFKQAWTTLFFVEGQRQPLIGNGGCDPVSQQAAYPGAVPCSGFVPEICPIYASLTSTGDGQPGQREVIFKSSMANYVDRVDAPTLLTVGLTDTLFTPTESAATYVAQRAGDVPVAMIWHRSGHGGYASPPGEGEPYTGAWDDTPEKQAEFANSYLPRRILQWFERHVRGVDVDTGPAFAWFRDWVDYDVTATGGTAAPAYGTATDFPDPAMPMVDHVVDFTTRTMDPDATPGGSAVALNPAGGAPVAYTETPNFTGDSGQFSGQQPTNVTGQFVALATAPMEVDTEFTGIPTASLAVSGANPAVDVRFFAKLYEVAPDDSYRLLRRQVAASRIPAADAAAGPVTVLLPPVAELIEAGNRIGLIIETTDAAYYNERTANTLTFSSDAASPSVVTLPLRPLATVAEPPVQPEPEPAPAPEPTPATGGGLVAGAVVLLAAVGLRRRA